MKKIALLWMFLVLSITLQAQTSWDFTVTPESDVAHLKADTQNWSYDATKDRYESKVAIEGAIKADGVELDLTKGLTVSGAAAKKIRIDVNKRLQLAGKNVSVVIPNLKKGQQLTVVCASTGDNATTFDQLNNLSSAEGFTAANSSTQQEGKATVSADGDVSFSSSTGSMNIFSISVSEAPEGGDNPEDPQPEVNVHAVAKNLAKNQAVLITDGGDALYYDTDALQEIAFDKETGTLTVVDKDGQWSDVFEKSVAELGFAKASAVNPEGTVENVEGKVVITEAKGWLETAYVKFEPFANATTYHVYVRGGQYTDYTKIDAQLVRDYANYGRADVVGLMAGTYDIKVVPVEEETEIEEAAKEAKDILVENYNRVGFAHKDFSGVGAYNDDGTLKEGAEVIYVTANNAKTVKANLSSGTFTGLQAIIDAYENKVAVTTPLAVRFIGTVSASDVDELQSKEIGLEIKGNKADWPMNITFEGIGDDATIRGFGFLIRNSKSVEVRNLGFIRYLEDGISFDTDNKNVWVHNNDFFYGKQGSGDKNKGDGAVDLKADTKFATIAYNHFWDCGKCTMCGMKGESGPNYISYHHNWFDHSDSRHARVRSMSVHIWNNYYDGCAKYGVGATTGSSIFVENNYFRHTKDPIMISLQGTDAKGDGTFSGEAGGMVKAFGNVYTEKGASSNYTPITYQDNNTSFDFYEAATRDEQVPQSVVSLVGNNTYNNFDTDEALMYAYEPAPAYDVPALVSGWTGAGRLNHGDLQWTFNNSVDDESYAINTPLASALDNYTSNLKGIFGGEDLNPGGGEGGEGGEGGGEGQQGGVISAAANCHFTGKACSNPSFTIVGNYSDSKGSATVNGVTYTECLKMESSTSVKFETSIPMTMTLYFASSEKASIKVDGTAYQEETNSFLTIDIEAGEHELTKNKSVNLFYIDLVPNP